MTTQTQYWIPDDPFLTEETLVAMSIPGAPPNSRREHRERLKDFLQVMIEVVGPQEAVEIVRDLVSERTLLMVDEPVTAADLAAVLLETDELQALPKEPKSHNRQKAFQTEARELTLEERIGRLLR